MSLFDLIQQIPAFMGHLIKKKGKYNDEYEEMKDGSKVPKMYGKFHLGS